MLCFAMYAVVSLNSQPSVAQPSYGLSVCMCMLGGVWVLLVPLFMSARTFAIPIVLLTWCHILSFVLSSSSIDPPQPKGDKILRRCQHSTQGVNM